MPFSLEDAQEAILDYINAEFLEDVYEQSISDSLLVARDERGNLKPYIAVDFGQITENGARTFAGPMTYDYNLSIRIRIVADKPKTARRISNKLVRKMLGFSTDWSGGVTQGRGLGGLLPITTSNMATEAYQIPVSFNLTVQLHEY